MIIHIIFIMIFTTIGVEGEMDYEMVEEFGDDFTIAINPARNELDNSTEALDRNFCCLFAAKYCFTPCTDRKSRCHVLCGYQGMFKCGSVRCWSASGSSCLAGPSTPAINYECGEGWKRKNDQCFKLFDDKLNYLDANNACIKLGGFLATIKDQDVQDVLFNFAAKGGAWIGGQDFLDEGKFAWLQDATLVDDSYTNWKTGQPNNIMENQHCMWMRLDGSWDDVTCKRRENYICQKTASTM